MSIHNSVTNKSQSLLGLGSFFGMSIGCFFGTGYGLFVGFGKIRCISNGICIIYPSRNPFMHSGLLTGCYCGIAIGFGFGNGLVNTIGLTKKLKINFPNYNIIFSNGNSLLEKKVLE